MAGFKLPQADGTDDKAGYLVDVVQLQVVTRRQARMTAQDENPLNEETTLTLSLLNLILKSQGTDPLSIKLRKELQQQPNNGPDIN